MAHLQFIERPTLRRPVLLLAFTGWVDGGQVGTSAINFLVEHWSARKLAELDPEVFYNFSRIRPQVHLGTGLTRIITWPETTFYYHVDPLRDRDFVLLVGVEPNFRWRTFCSELFQVCDAVGVTSAMSLGGVIAEALHTRRPHIRTTTADPELIARFPDLRVQRGGYQGPTGIIGVLGDVLTRANIPVGNMRGSVPHYIAGWPNPQVRHALLARVSELYGLGLELSELEAASTRFRQQVDESLRENAEMTEYVRRLEERMPEPPEEPRPGADTGPQGTTGSADLPRGEDIVREFEEFLRERSSQEDDPPPDRGQS